MQYALCLALLIGVSTFMHLSIATAQTTDTTLGWEYPVSEEGNIDRFVLQRKDGGGVYVDVIGDINKSMRVVTDTGTPTGVMVCYVMFAERGMSGSGVRSIASNEPCFAALAPVTNLRKK